MSHFYFYNGILLPEISGYGFPSIVLFKYGDRYQIIASTTQYKYYDSTIYGINAASGTSAVSYEGSLRWVRTTSPDVNTQAGEDLIHATPLWSNIDILDNSGNVYLRASEPVSAPEYDFRMVVDPSIDYYYESDSREEIKVWLNLTLQNSVGGVSELTPELVEWSVDGTNSVRNVRLVRNTYNDYGIHSLVLLYERDVNIQEPRWFVRFKLKVDNSIGGTLEMRVIRLTSDVYNPGLGGGVDSGAVGPGPNGSFGGGGDFGIDPSTGQPVQSDDIVSSLPGIGTPSGSYEGSVANAGLFVHYAMNATMLEVVGDWLWADNLGLIIAKEVLSILYGSPIESAISLMSYPFNVTALPGVVTRQQNIYWGSHEIGGLSGGISGTAITNPYATIDWGTIQLTEFWGNFLDYAPHTKLELYLPWCTGFVPIDPNECLPGSLRVVTNIELAKGTCLHNVIGNDGRVIATHSGTCGKQLPLTALDTSGKALSMITAAVSTAVAGSAGAAATRAGEIAYGNYLAGARQLGLSPSEAVTGGHVVRQEAMAPHIKNQNRARNMALAGSAAAARVPSSVHRNGSFTGSTAGLGVQYPYLIISRPTQSVPKQYGHHYGYPSNIYAPLLTLKGYTEIGEVHLTGFTCTEDELTEIDSLLKSGVIL